jgi:hypothetical protein
MINNRMQAINPITAYLLKHRIIYNGYFITVFEHKDAQFYLKLETRNMCLLHNNSWVAMLSE